MGEWAEILRGDLDSVTPGLADAIGLKTGITSEQFEEILGAFTRWEASLSLAERFKLVGGPTPGSLETPVHAWLQRTRTRADELSEALNTTLYREFGRDSIAADKAESAMAGLIDRLGGRNTELAFATTNYDPSLEVGLAGSGLSPIDGFNRSPWESPLLDVQGMGSWQRTHERGVPVLHLHGAVGWYRREDGRITFQSPDQPYNPTLGSPVVLAPDPDKDPSADIYVAAIWHEFEAALQGATHVLVLGHSLRDRPLVRAMETAAGHAKIAITYYYPSESAIADQDREGQAGIIESVTEFLANSRVLKKARIIAANYGPEPEFGSGFEPWIFD